MNQKGTSKEQQTGKRKTFYNICSVLGLVLSVVCCAALIHVEIRIKQGISHEQMEKEILRKVQQYHGRWEAMALSQWKETRGNATEFV